MNGRRIRIADNENKERALLYLNGRKVNATFFLQFFHFFDDDKALD